MFSKAVVFLFLWSVISQSAFSFTDNALYKSALAEFQARTKKDNAVAGMPERYAAQFIAVHKAFEAAAKSSKALPTEEDVERIQQQALINVHHTRCTVGKDTTACADKGKQVTYYKTQYYADPKFKPQISDIPTYDGAKKLITVPGGTTIDLSTGVVARVAVPAVPAAPIAADPSASAAGGKIAVTNGEGAKAKKTGEDGEGEKPKAKGEGAEGEDPNVAAGSEAKYNATCEWSDLPRKLLRGPGCYTVGTQICSGYVKCNGTNAKGPITYERLATCSESLYADDNATACAKQMGYGSKSAGVAGSKFTNSIEDKKERAAQ